MLSGVSSPSKATTKKRLLITADQLNTNQQLVPVQYLAGRRYIPGQDLSPCYNKVSKKVSTSSGGKFAPSAGGTTVNYVDFGMMFCMGGRMPPSKIFRVIVDSEIVWSNESGLDLTAANPTHISVPSHG